MTMDTDAERMRILERIERGEIDAAEGMRLIAALPPAEEQPAEIDNPSAAFTQPAPGHSPTPPPDPEIEKWKRWWMIPVWVGAAITVVGGWLMYSALSASGVGFWFACAWLPFLIGVAILALAWGSRSSRWIHVRVHTGQTSWPRVIAISLPLFAGLTAWVLRTVSPYIPQLRKTALDELILALNDNTTPQRPFYVDVTEGDNGERIQVYIG